VAESGTSVKNFFEKNVPRFLEPGSILGFRPCMPQHSELQGVPDLSTEDREFARWKDERVAN